jgi:hypothetical protein
MVAACGALVCQVKTRTKVKGVRDCEKRKRGREKEGETRGKGNEWKGVFGGL